MGGKLDGVTCAFVFVAVCVSGWFLPEPYVYYLWALLAIGVLFDILSFACHVKTLVTGRFSSGLPGVGLLFYLWFVLAYPRSLLAPDETAVGPLLFDKLLDFLLLTGVHTWFQMPGFFAGPRGSE